MGKGAIIIIYIKNAHILMHSINIFQSQIKSLLNKALKAETISLCRSIIRS